MKLAAAGLIPMSPVIAVTPVVEISVFARITKLPAVPRFTGAGLEATAAGTRVASINVNLLMTIVKFFKLFFIKNSRVSESEFRPVLS